MGVYWCVLGCARDGWNRVRGERIMWNEVPDVSGVGPRGSVGVWKAFGFPLTRESKPLEGLSRALTRLAAEVGMDCKSLSRPVAHPFFKCCLIFFLEYPWHCFTWFSIMNLFTQSDVIQLNFAKIDWESLALNFRTYGKKLLS